MNLGEFIEFVYCKSLENVNRFILKDRKTTKSVKHLKGKAYEVISFSSLPEDTMDISWDLGEMIANELGEKLLKLAANDLERKIVKDYGFK